MLFLSVTELNTTLWSIQSQVGLETANLEAYNQTKVCSSLIYNPELFQTSIKKEIKGVNQGIKKLPLLISPSVQVCRFWCLNL